MFSKLFKDLQSCIQSNFRYGGDTYLKLDKMKDKHYYGDEVKRVVDCDIATIDLRLLIVNDLPKVDECSEVDYEQIKCRYKQEQNIFIQSMIQLFSSGYRPSRTAPIQIHPIAKSLGVICKDLKYTVIPQIIKNKIVTTVSFKIEVNWSLCCDYLVKESV